MMKLQQALEEGEGEMQRLCLQMFSSTELCSVHALSDLFIYFIFIST